MVVLALLALQAAGDLDPRARAVREAYEEQLRADRRQVSMVHLRRTSLGSLSAPDGLHRMTSSGGIAFLRIWAEGDLAYRDLIETIDGASSLDDARTAVHVLNQLTGRRSPLPDERTRALIKGEWEQWLRDPSALPECRHADGDLQSLLGRLADDTLEARLDAERALASCARRHKPLLEEALRGTKDVETAARLRSLLTDFDSAPLGDRDLSTLAVALEMIRQGELEVGADTLRAVRGRFRGVHRATLEVVLRALER